MLKIQMLEQIVNNDENTKDDVRKKSLTNSVGGSGETSCSYFKYGYFDENG